MPGFTDVHEERVETPFGDPSDAFVLGELAGRRVAFLARHGRGHRILPSELNFRANIYAFKKLGVERILSVSAVGSLKEEHKPTDFIMPDQFIDRTFHRISTFFGDGIVGHIALNLLTSYFNRAFAIDQDPPEPTQAPEAVPLASARPAA